MTAASDKPRSTASDRPTLAPFLSRHDGVSLIVLVLSTGEFHVCNETARIVLGMCDGLRTTDQIVHDVGQAFAVDESVIRAEITSTISHFVASEILAIGGAKQ